MIAPVGEVGGEPLQGRALHDGIGLEEDAMVHNVKCCAQVKLDQDAG